MHQRNYIKVHHFVFVNILILLLDILILTEKCEAKPKFLNHSPLDNQRIQFDYDYHSDEIFDSDIKIPGRHMPRLSYYHPTRNDFSDPRMYNHGGSHRSSSFYNIHNEDRLRKNPDIFAVQKDEDPERSSPVRRTVSYKERNNPYDIKSFEPEKENLSPRFDRSLPRNTTVQSGQTAVLSCRVLHRGDKSISWIRLEDLHILTVNKFKYAIDKRLSVLYNQLTEEWVLRIRNVNHNDAGKFECQISSNPVLSFIVNLNIVDYPVTTTEAPHLHSPRDMAVEGSDKEQEKTVPHAVILHGPDIHVNQGSLINLTCKFQQEDTMKMPYVQWHQDTKMGKTIDYRRVKVVTQVFVSNFIIEDAMPSDSGKYTCDPIDAEEATVTVHVLNDETTAAMHQNNSSERLSSSYNWLFNILNFIFYVYINIRELF